MRHSRVKLYINDNVASLQSNVWTSYHFEQLLRLQDVLLHLVRIRLHAGDEHGQVVGLSPA